MHINVWVRYLLGRRDAIALVAGNKSALWTGIALVMLTAIARNYDQTFIGENPVLWLFGPLLFSLVSGTWLYAVVYAGFARRRMDASEPLRASSRWLGFMGLFWMTAPIAWLYAIPVERFFDSITAAKANLALLAMVSAWRVLLMARVMQVLVKAPFLMALIWVLFAASIEVLVVFFFGGQFARAILAGMGGMRNSPEEEILFRASSTAFSAAFWTAPITFLLAWFLSSSRSLIPLPAPVATPLRWSSIAVAGIIWVAIAIHPQRQVANTVAVEKLLAHDQPRAALDYLSAHQPQDFAPGRTLPPKPFERSIFEELPACFAVLQPTDAPWVRAFMIRRLDEMCSHYDAPWQRRRKLLPKPLAEQLKDFQNGLTRFGPEPKRLLSLIGGLIRIPEGNAWLNTNTLFVEGLRQAAKDSEPVHVGHDSTPADQQHLDWLAVSNRINTLAPATPATMP